MLCRRDTVTGQAFAGSFRGRDHLQTTGVRPLGASQGCHTCPPPGSGTCTGLQPSGFTGGTAVAWNLASSLTISATISGCSAARLVYSHGSAVTLKRPCGGGGGSGARAAGGVQSNDQDGHGTERAALAVLRCNKREQMNDDTVQAPPADVPTVTVRTEHHKDKKGKSAPKGCQKQKSTHRTRSCTRSGPPGRREAVCRIG